MTFKKVMRYSKPECKLRLFRVMWERGVVGDGKGYSSKVAISLVPKMFGWQSEFNSWRLTLLGVSAHWARSYGGSYV